jgi:hypothetical protein
MEGRAGADLRAFAFQFPALAQTGLAIGRFQETIAPFRHESANMTAMHTAATVPVDTKRRFRPDGNSTSTSAQRF